MFACKAYFDEFSGLHGNLDVHLRFCALVGEPQFEHVEVLLGFPNKIYRKTWDSKFVQDLVAIC